MRNRVIDMVNPRDRLFIKVLTYFFVFLLSRFNLPFSVFVAYINQFFLPVVLLDILIANCFDNKFKFYLFIVLLILMQSLT